MHAATLHDTNMNSYSYKELKNASPNLGPATLGIRTGRSVRPREGGTKTCFEVIFFPKLSHCTPCFLNSGDSAHGGRRSRQRQIREQRFAANILQQYEGSRPDQLLQMSHCPV